MKYTLLFKKSAEKELLALPKNDAFKVRDAILGLTNNPRPSGCKKLSGTEDDYRIRVGRYRVVYSISDNVLTVRVIKIAHRKDVYR
jgi:mRNA interferase RelE/StbE